MARRLEDGNVVPISELLSGQCTDPDTGRQLKFSNISGDKNSFVAQVPRSDGRKTTFRFTKPTDFDVRVSRTVE
jgi:hypothetical protein